jgi:hypothetical protein
MNQARRTPAAAAAHPPLPADLGSCAVSASQPTWRSRLIQWNPNLDAERAPREVNGTLPGSGIKGGPDRSPPTLPSYTFGRDSGYPRDP